MISSSCFTVSGFAAGLHTALTDAIDESTFFVVCLTRLYARKVRDGAEVGTDNCQFEFNYAISRKEARAVLVLVMEDACLDIKTVRGPVGAVAASKLYFDFATDTSLDGCVAALAASLAELIPSGRRSDGTLIPAQAAAAVEAVPALDPSASGRLCRASVGDLLCVTRPDGHTAYGRIAWDSATGDVRFDSLLVGPAPRSGSEAGPGSEPPSPAAGAGTSSLPALGGGSADPAAGGRASRTRVWLGQDALPLSRARLAAGEMPGLREVVAVRRSDGRLTVGQVVSVGSGQVRGPGRGRSG